MSTTPLYQVSRSGAGADISYLPMTITRLEAFLDREKARGEEGGDLRIVRHLVIDEVMPRKPVLYGVVLFDVRSRRYVGQEGEYVRELPARVVDTAPDGRLMVEVLRVLDAVGTKFTPAVAIRAVCFKARQ